MKTMESKREKLRTMAARGGTPNERETAARMLRDLPAIRPEESDDKWSGQGILTRDRRGAKAYLRGVALAAFLKQVKDGRYFGNRDMKLSDDFGMGDFYTVLSWLLKLDLVVKDGSRYVIPSRNAVMTAWNTEVDMMKFKV